MKTIIVPVDFSYECLNGLDLALMLAGKSNAGIQLVHVIPSFINVPHGTMETERQSARVKLEELIKRFKTENIPMSYIIREGKIYKEVTSQADSYEDSVVALSTHGESGLEEHFIGSNAYKITSTSRKPVFSIRASVSIHNIDNIVLPLDITYQTREKVPYTARLARLLKSKIHIVTVRTSNLKSIEKRLQKYSVQVGAFLKYHDIQYTVEHLHGGNLTDLTLEYTKAVDGDLISIMTEQEKSVSNLLLGNYAHQMINKALIPVLSFPTYQIGLILEDLRTQGVYIYDDQSIK